MSILSGLIWLSLFQFAWAESSYVHVQMTAYKVIPTAYLLTRETWNQTTSTEEKNLRAVLDFYFIPGDLQSAFVKGKFTVRKRPSPLDLLNYAAGVPIPNFVATLPLNPMAYRPTSLVNDELRSRDAANQALEEGLVENERIVYQSQLWEDDRVLFRLDLHDENEDALRAFLNYQEITVGLRKTDFEQASEFFEAVFDLKVSHLSQFDGQDELVNARNRYWADVSRLEMTAAEHAEIARFVETPTKCRILFD